MFWIINSLLEKEQLSNWSTCTRGLSLPFINSSMKLSCRVGNLFFLIHYKFSELQKRCQIYLHPHLAPEDRSEISNNTGDDRWLPFYFFFIRKDPDRHAFLLQSSIQQKRRYLKCQAKFDDKFYSKIECQMKKVKMKNKTKPERKEKNKGRFGMSWQGN